MNVELVPCDSGPLGKVLNLSQSSLNKLFEFSETRLLAISQSYTIGFQKKLDNRNRSIGKPMEIYSEKLEKPEKPEKPGPS